MNMRAIGFLVVATALLSGCMGPALAPPAADVRPFGDSRDFILLDDLSYQIGDSGLEIVVPRGFVTDFASIPRSLWSFGLSPHGRYSRAAVIHDYLYWSQVCSKDQSDRLLVIAMKESNVGSFQESIIFEGVHVGGQGSWDGNAKERRRGLPRVIPGAYMRPPPNDAWPKYRQFLVDKGVKDPSFSLSPSVCDLGNTTDVPGGPPGGNKLPPLLVPRS
jgi:hypothetical protein